MVYFETFLWQLHPKERAPIAPRGDSIFEIEVSTWLISWHAVNRTEESTRICFFGAKRLRESFFSSTFIVAAQKLFQLRHQTATRHFLWPYLFAILKIQLRKGWSCHRFHTFFLFSSLFYRLVLRNALLKNPLNDSQGNIFFFVTSQNMSWQL